MKKMIAVICCTCFLAQAKAQLVTNRYDEAALFEIEKQFSDMSFNKGFRIANLFYAADSALVFRPRIQHAKEWAYNLKSQDSSYSITWYPSFIEMSAAGDLGYATGPFDNVSTIPGDSSANHGQFVTVWKVQADGTLKFIMDFGSGPLSRNEFVKKEPVFIPVAAIKKSFKKAGLEKYSSQVMVAEKDLSAICETAGDLAGYAKYAAADIRFFYQREFYTIGLDKVKQRLEKQAGKHSWKLLHINMAASGELAHVYGTHEFMEGDKKRTGYYMRIWKKQANGKWIIAVQVRNLL